jgi:hypothetical protein
MEKLVSDRLEEVEDEDSEVAEVAEELIEHGERYDRRDTLKHGTAAENLDSIVEDLQLKSGAENDSVAGEAGNQNWVRMTHIFPLAKRYGEDAYPSKDKLLNKADNWVNFLHKNYADWRDDLVLQEREDREYIRNTVPEVPEGSHLEGTYERVLNVIEKLERMEEGIDDDPIVFEVPVGSAEDVESSAIDNYDQLDASETRYVEIEGVKYEVVPGEAASTMGVDKTEDEIEALEDQKTHLSQLTPKEMKELDEPSRRPDDPMQETRIQSASLDEEANIYVPHSRLEEFRDKFEDRNFTVLTLEAKSLQHELRMSERYKQEGTVSYKLPWDIHSTIVDFQWRLEDYNEDPEYISISG